MSAGPGKFIWYELMTSDADAAAKFYHAVIGWNIRDDNPGVPGYRFFCTEHCDVGGFMTIPAEAAQHGAQAGWFTYISVPDCDAAAAAVKAAGGTVHVKPNDIPGVGRWAMVADPQGALFYIMRGFHDGESPSHKPNTPKHGCWHELHTSNWEAARDFYFAQFGWQATTEMPIGAMGTYLQFNLGGDAVGGMMTNPGMPQPMWVFYFGVEDITVAEAAITAHGGTIEYAPHQVPDGSWILCARDPQGAMFGLVAPGTA